MSVRATDRLLGDVVIATGLSNSPRMVVQSVEIEEKLVNTIWFSDDHGAQTGTFPATSLDRAESAPAAKKTAKPAKKSARKR
jgi:hypothetical protein